jgi:predicted RNA-binding Zn ribbon-like protein
MNAQAKFGDLDDADAVATFSLARNVEALSKVADTGGNRRAVIALQALHVELLKGAITKNIMKSRRLDKLLRSAVTDI